MKVPNQMAGKLGKTRKSQSGDYRVGKNKPPVESQFRPGQSGNPKGRPKGKTTVHEQVSTLLARKIPVPENGVTRMMSLQETMLLAVGQKAVRGDLKAVAFLLNLREATRDNTSTLIDPASLAAFDQATLRRYMQDVLDREAGPTEVGDASSGKRCPPSDDDPAPAAGRA